MIAISILCCFLVEYVEEMGLSDAKLGKKSISLMQFSCCACLSSLVRQKGHSQPWPRNQWSEMPENEVETGKKARALPNQHFPFKLSMNIHERPWNTQSSVASRNLHLNPVPFEGGVGQSLPVAGCSRDHPAPCAAVTFHALLALQEPSQSVCC